MTVTCILIGNVCSSSYATADSANNKSNAEIKKHAARQHAFMTEVTNVMSSKYATSCRAAFMNT